MNTFTVLNVNDEMRMLNYIIANETRSPHMSSIYGKAETGMNTMSFALVCSALNVTYLTLQYL